MRPRKNPRIKKSDDKLPRRASFYVSPATRARSKDETLSKVTSGSDLDSKVIEAINNLPEDNMLFTDLSKSVDYFQQHLEQLSQFRPALEAFIKSSQELCKDDPGISAKLRPYKRIYVNLVALIESWRSLKSK